MPGGSAPPDGGGGSIPVDLAPELRRNTLALCGSYFFCLLSVYVGTNGCRRCLRAPGSMSAVASYGLTVFNLGGVVGAILGAIIIECLGSRTTMLAMTAGAVAGSIAAEPAGH